MIFSSQSEPNYNFPKCTKNTIFDLFSLLVVQCFLQFAIRNLPFHLIIFGLTSQQVATINKVFKSSVMSRLKASLNITSLLRIQLWLPNWLDKKDYSKLIERRSERIRLRSGRLSFLSNGHCTTVHWMFCRQCMGLVDVVDKVYKGRVRNRDFVTIFPKNLETDMRNQDWLATQNVVQGRIPWYTWQHGIYRCTKPFLALIFLTKFSCDNPTQLV